jgi:hypothetical protein
MPTTRRLPRWLPWAIFAGYLMLSGALVLWAGRETLFRGDDWDLLLYRGGWSPDVFLVPHNEHLSALLVAFFKAIPAVAGPHYGAFRLALLALDVCLTVLFFLFARERVGDWLALLAAAPLMLMGGGSDNLIWPTQIGVVGSLACGTGMLILLDRDGLPARLGSMALLTASIWFSSDGLFFLAAGIIWLGLSRDRWRQLWIVVVPTLTFLAWYPAHGESTFTAGNLRATPKFVLDSAAGGVSALTGVRPQIAHAQAIGAAAGVVGLALLILLLRRIRPRLTPRLIAIVTLAPVSWVLIALGRAEGGDPFASRYVYASALFILMAVLEVVRGERVQRLLSGWRYAALALLVGISLVLSANILFDKGGYWRSVSEYVHGRTSAIEMTRRTIDPNLLLEPLPDMAHMTAGWFLNAVEKWEESPTGATDIAGLSEEGRSAADQVLAAGAPARFVPPPSGLRPSGPPPRVDPGGSPARARGSCVIARPGSIVSVEVPAHGLLIRPHGAAIVQLRRYASGYEAAPTTQVESSRLLAFAADLSSVPWHVQVSAEAGAAVCGVRVPRGLVRGPRRPREGGQHCLSMSLGEDECRFTRY